MRASPTHRGVDFLVKVRLLQFEEPAVVLDLGVGAVLDVHRGLLALSLPDARVSVGLDIVVMAGEGRIYLSISSPEPRRSLRPS